MKFILGYNSLNSYYWIGNEISVNGEFVNNRTYQDCVAFLEYKSG